MVAADYTLLTPVNKWKAAGGWYKQFTHASAATGTTMRFTVFFPPQAEKGPVPVLYYLSGLTCTDENFVQKAAAHRRAAERGLAIVAPDTSPRGAGVEGEDADWDFGTGAGFYLDATQPQWSKHYRMYTYITQELPKVVAANFGKEIQAYKAAICGHSMGGHGALTIAMKNPEAYKSCSAFAPIAHPTACPWGVKAFTGYLGEDRAAWEEYDATLLMEAKGPFPFKILVDQGEADNFLAEQLKPQEFEAACLKKGQTLTIRRQEGYDHSYFFISTFIGDHIDFHAEALGL